MATSRSPKASHKIIQILEAPLGWRYVTWHPKNGSIINISPIAMWALYEDGRVAGLCPGPRGLEDGMQYENTTLEFHSPAKVDLASEKLREEKSKKD
jgi:hypothetical protein